MDSWASVELVGPLVKGPTWCFRSCNVAPCWVKQDLQAGGDGLDQLRAVLMPEAPRAVPSPPCGLYWPPMAEGVAGGTRAQGLTG